MAVSISTNSSPTVILSSLSLLINVSFADQNNTNSTVAVITNAAPPPPLSLPPPLLPPRSVKPSIPVMIGIITTVFSVTFLLLLYAKHCKRRDGAVYVHHHHHHHNHNNQNQNRFDRRKNSGLDRTVIESLPVFRFEALSGGGKEGLECAVCLARFEPPEVLRLLPKCNHAFHVECVDTWLDAHSTCPLCRYRVDPEDVLLIRDSSPWFDIRFEEEEYVSRAASAETASGRVDPDFWVRRISGRHSSAGERASRVNESGHHQTSNSSSSYRRSLDSSLRNNNNNNNGVDVVGCYDRAQRKDGLLLSDDAIVDRKSFERLLEHRIIISSATASGGSHHRLQRDQRWSDVATPSDLLYVRSEMIMSGRSVSEMTSMERLWRRESENINSNSDHRHRRQRQASAFVSRWLAWAVRPHRTTDSSIA